MKINARTHLEIRLQNLIFTLLFLGIVGLLAWLSTRYTVEFDWTVGGRNTLSEAGRKVLDVLKEPVKITAYAREEKGLRERIVDQVGRFSRHKKDLTLNFVNPDTQPDKVRELGITVDGELRIEYQGRSEEVQEASEGAIANALQRLASAGDRHIVFLEGHGERSPKGQANHDLGQFGEELRRKGMVVSLLNLATTPAIPDNTSVLVIAGPRVNLLPGETKLVQEYLDRGGNLLWLAEPGDLRGLQPLAQKLGLKFLSGQAVDASAQLFGINDPTFVLVAEYPPHPLVMGFDAMTLFPTAAALDNEGEGAFERTPFLKTLPRSWTETGPIEGKIQFDADKDERAGPLTIGYALTRKIAESASDKKAEAGQTGGKKTEGSDTEKSPPQPVEQRIVVLGDGDFLSNSYLGNGGNLNLGMNMIHWLSQNEQFINIPAKTAPDRNLNLSPVASGAIGLGFLFVIPAALFGSGAFIWLRRRRR